MGCVKLLTIAKMFARLRVLGSLHMLTEILTHFDEQEGGEERGGMCDLFKIDFCLSKAVVKFHGNSNVFRCNQFHCKTSL